MFVFPCRVIFITKCCVYCSVTHTRTLTQTRLDRELQDVWSLPSQSMQHKIFFSHEHRCITCVKQGGSPVSNMGKDPILHTMMHYGRYTFFIIFVLCFFKQKKSTLLTDLHNWKSVWPHCGRQARMRWAWAMMDAMRCRCCEEWTSGWRDDQQITDNDAEIQKSISTEYSYLKDATGTTRKIINKIRQK